MRLLAVKALAKWYRLERLAEYRLVRRLRRLRPLLRIDLPLLCLRPPRPNLMFVSMC